MRAVVFDRHGPPEVLRVADLDDPQPGAGQVRVRVRAGGVQPFDTAVRQGSMAIDVTFPQQLGNEFAGIIDEVGPGVGGWTAGDEVLGWAHMTSLAELVVTERDAIVDKPTGMGWDVAGALGASGQTALTALADLRVGADDTLLVHAAAGGAGAAAVQIAGHRGANVIGTASPANHEYLRSLGATPVVYGDGLVDRVRALAPRGVDAALDAVGGQALRDSLALVADRDRIATLVEHDLAGHLGVRGVRARRSVEHLRELTALYAEGALDVAIRSRYSLDQVADAHRDVESGHGRGKVIVTQY